MSELSNPVVRRRAALWLFAALFVLYFANGREIGAVDSQPAKFTAREVAVMGTLALDRIVAERPGLSERPAFATSRDGHVRSAYPVLPGLIAAVPAVVLHRTGLVDMDAPLAPNLVAKLTATTLVAAAGALVLLAVSRLVPLRAALFTAIGLGLGTNWWALASQTLWQHETVAFGLALALWAWLRDDDGIGTRALVAGGLGLAMAGAARPQVAPIVAMLLVWIAARRGAARAAVPAAIVAASALAVVAVNIAWFGHVLGAAPRLEALHPTVHGVTGSVGAPWVGAAGLLVSPSRGLLVFSPVVIVALAGLAVPRPAGWRLGWIGGAALMQFAAYSCYSVWWAGFTYGPRYLIDLLPLIAPFGALGCLRLIRTARGRRFGGVLLGWSVGVAALGAFVYPNEAWNTRPASVDRHHARLWDVTDPQILRAAASPASPQNFDLFAAEAVRRP